LNKILTIWLLVQMHRYWLSSDLPCHVPVYGL
jgi:hypothetical protein